MNADVLAKSVTLSVDDFENFHRGVHGYAPFAWQSRLMRQVVKARAWPLVLDLPTGSGKTTCIDIAVFALALDASSPHGQRWCPRRVAMVVDRRIVVDQVAERGRKLLRALTGDRRAPGIDAKDAAALDRTATLLRSLSREAEEPLGVFTLRGGMPKDDGWARTPDQPLILASTVDQLGSRLLLQGYGVSPGMKPVHAGMLGNDLLLLLDEVHLSQPFAETLNALGHLRGRFAKTSSLKPRFHHAFLSATPGESSQPPFGLTDEEKGTESALGPRLHASKRARLRDEDDRSAVEKACIDEACALSQKHDVVAVVVNRVASASTIVRQLRETLQDAVDIVLLTGRMRPLDRDDVLQPLRPRIMTGRDRGAVGKKLIVVGTQCIEAGADFDFDALVTEAASLDALRQRFGRVDRLGLYCKAEGVIVRDKSAKDDPIYGTALAATAAWLRGRLAKKTKDVDFGVMALPVPPADELKKLVAPIAHAPVLLPAYLDLWMQTSPAPVVVPDVSLWLHGPASGPADVQIVWRADLDEKTLENSEATTTIVSALRPSSLEAISLPFVAALLWLGGKDVGDIADVEGVGGEQGVLVGGRALRWRGDDSKVITAAELRPGDTIVVPSVRGGISDACFDPRALNTVPDLAERAALFGRAQPLLRLHPVVLRQLGLTLPTDDLEETRAALSVLAESEVTPWRQLWLNALASGKAAAVVDVAEPWAVLHGKRLKPDRLRQLLHADHSLEDGIEVTTDDDDSFHAGRSVALAEHSNDVERFARVYAGAAGLPPQMVSDLALAGWLHDIGKADRRFQVLLRGGSEIAFFKDETHWAKSGMSPGAKGAHRLAQKKSRYPPKARHEVQSVAMIEKNLDAVKGKAHDVDLVLHLVASHHGHCRPFAPVVVDDAPVDVSLLNHTSDDFGTVDFAPTTSKHGMHRLDAPLADRFWRLVETYGWLELCWLEALLRLADHRASQHEQEVSDET